MLILFVCNEESPFFNSELCLSVSTRVRQQ